jgi:ankyrin repeat protein
VVRLLLARGADANARSDFLGPDGEATDPGATGPVDRAEWSGGMTPLVFASREADSEAAGILLDAGADVNLAMANGSTALLVAILNRHNTLALTLLDAGADPNLADGRGQTPLYAAIDMRNLEVTEVPPPEPDDVDELPLIDALLDHGADPNIQVTAKLPYRGGINATWLNVDGASSFYRAAASGDITVMRRLLEFGADPRTAAADGTTPLMVVSGIGWRPGISHTWPEGDQIAALELCLELGADVTDVNDAGLTALHGAAFKGWDRAVRVLVEHGARLDAQDTDGRIPLEWAEGVSFAAQPPQRQESTVALIVELMDAAGLTDPEPAEAP